MRHLIPITASLAAGLLACSERARPPAADNLAIELKPLALAAVGDICYGVTVTAKDDTVWSQTNLCSSQYGDGRGALTYVGPCVAGVDNLVTIDIESVVGKDKAPIPFVDPSPIAQSVPCIANADTPVVFDITLMFSAEQGFFDIVVDFEDVFCSAKVDCAIDGKPLTLLHDPATSKRDTTVVAAFACTAGPGSDTVISMDSFKVICDQGTFPAAQPLDPTAGPGNLWISDDLFYQVAIYRGVEELGDLNKRYWNLAFGLHDDTGPALGVSGTLTNCKLSGAVTVSDGKLDNGSTPANTTYPFIAVEVPLNGSASALTCTQHPLGGGTGVTPSYVNPTKNPEGRPFEWWFDGKKEGPYGPGTDPGDARFAECHLDLAEPGSVLATDPTNPRTIGFRFHGRIDGFDGASIRNEMSLFLYLESVGPGAEITRRFDGIPVSPDGRFDTIVQVPTTEGARGVYVVSSYANTLRRGGDGGFQAFDDDQPTAHCFTNELALQLRQIFN